MADPVITRAKFYWEDGQVEVVQVETTATMVWRVDRRNGLHHCFRPTEKIDNEGDAVWREDPFPPIEL
jgi:hypothetical protein